jgi:hypothetical protein
MKSERSRYRSDLGAFFSVVSGLILATLFYYYEFYGAVLAGIYCVGILELYDRTLLGRKVRAFLRGEKSE